MQRAIERRLSHLEALIPPRFTFARFVRGVCKRARRRGVSPGSALTTAFEGLSVSELDVLLEDLEGKHPVRSDDEAPEAIGSSAAEMGFSPEDVELVVRYYGGSGF